MFNIRFTSAAVKSSWCLYLHRVHFPDGPKVMFLGRCKFNDVLRSPDAQRNKLWQEKVRHADFIDLEVVQVSDDRQFINTEFSRLYRVHRPICNTTSHITTGRGRVVCDQTGVIYENANQAAKAFGVASSNMSTHLRGSSNNKTVGGHTFSYVKEN